MNVPDRRDVKREGITDAAAALEGLRKRYELLNKKRIEADANLANAAEALEQLRNEAREKFGTDDPAALQAKLAEIKAENDRKLTEYRGHLEQIEKQLSDVEAAQNK